MELLETFIPALIATFIGFYLGYLFRGWYAKKTASHE